MLIEQALPDDEFLNRKGVSFAGFFQADETGANGIDDLGLARRDPTLRVRRGQILKGHGVFLCLVGRGFCGLNHNSRIHFYVFSSDTGAALKNA